MVLLSPQQLLNAGTNADGRQRSQMHAVTPEVDLFLKLMHRAALCRVWFLAVGDVARVTHCQ